MRLKDLRPVLAYAKDTVEEETEAEAEENATETDSGTPSNVSLDMDMGRSRTTRAYCRRLLLWRTKVRRERNLEHAYGECLVEGGMPSYSSFDVDAKYFSQALLLPLAKPLVESPLESARSEIRPKPPPITVFQITQPAEVYDGDEIVREDMRPLQRGSWIRVNKEFSSNSKWLQLCRYGPEVFFILAKDAAKHVPNGRTHMYGAVKQNILRAVRQKNSLALTHALLVAEASLCDRKDELVELATKELDQIIANRGCVGALSSVTGFRGSIAMDEQPRKSLAEKLTPYQCYKLFCKWAKQKYGSLASTWVALDPTRAMCIGKVEFFMRCKSLGFNLCPLQPLWNFIDRDSSGTLTLVEMDPQGSEEMGSFLIWLRGDIYGSSLSSTFSGNLIKYFCKTERSVLTGQLMEQIGVRYKGKLNVLRALVHLADNQFVHQKDLDFVTRIRLPDYFKCAANHSIFRNFVKKAKFRYGSTFQTWRAMDINNTMRVCWKNFEAVFEEAMSVGSELEMLASKQKQNGRRRKGVHDCGAAWRCLDPNGTGWASFKHFDSYACDSLLRLREDGRKASGTVLKHLEKFEAQEGTLGRLRVRADNGIVSAEGRQVVEMLEICDPHKKLKPADFKCIDNWDVAWEADTARPKKSGRQVSTLMTRPPPVCSAEDLFESEVGLSSQGRFTQAAPRRTVPFRRQESCEVQSPTSGNSSASMIVKPTKNGLAAAALLNIISRSRRTSHATEFSTGKSQRSFPTVVSEGSSSDSDTSMVSPCSRRTLCSIASATSYQPQRTPFHLHQDTEQSQAEPVYERLSRKTTLRPRKSVSILAIGGESLVEASNCTSTDAYLAEPAYLRFSGRATPRARKSVTILEDPTMSSDDED